MDEITLKMVNSENVHFKPGKDNTSRYNKGIYPHIMIMKIYQYIEFMQHFWKTQQHFSKLTSCCSCYLGTDLVALDWVAAAEIRNCRCFLEKLLLL